LDEPYKRKRTKSAKIEGERAAMEGGGWGRRGQNRRGADKNGGRQIGWRRGGGGLQRLRRLRRGTSTRKKEERTSGHVE